MLRVREAVHFQYRIAQICVSIQTITVMKQWLTCCKQPRDVGSRAGNQMAHVTFWHSERSRAGIQMACGTPGTHMTVSSRDVMYKLWYVFTICEFSLLEFDFLESLFAFFLHCNLRRI